jgi:predicted dehydrogenase
MSLRPTRRRFLQTTAAAGAAAAMGGFWTFPSRAARRMANDKLNIAMIGTSNQAGFTIDNVKQENIAAICDIDDNLLDACAKDFPKAQKFNDFRKLMDEESIDAVCVCTPDHIHAPATAMALKHGKHVYCEKPLTHTIYEARVLTQLAAETKKATQMGTQIHATDNYRRVVELIQSGAIGAVKEVDVWVGKGWGGGERPTDRPEVPKTLHWDLWLGPAAERPYSPIYVPANWRRWWDFGGGTLADMGCHYIDLVFWSLKLVHPTTAEAFGPPEHPETAPLGLKVVWEFPARGDLPPVTMSWRDGDQTPSEVRGVNVPGAGIMFVGEKGMLFADYGGYKLYPEDQFQGFTSPEKSIPDTIGHHNEWIAACKTGSPTTCNFSYAGPLTETVLLGNVAYRSGKKIEWKAESMKIPNAPEAEKFLKRQYRQGWTL